jgi:anti-sigma regulatory factor (Ser/Thr protein kinase)
MSVENAPNVLLRLPNRAENVSLVREMLHGLADALRLDRSRLDDIKTAVSEACNNVVLHAYEGGEGPMELRVHINEDSLEVVVIDEGGGIRPRPVTDERMQGIGLSVIQALTDRTVFRGAAGEGTEVRMEFYAGGQLSAYKLTDGVGPDMEARLAPPGETSVAVAPAGELSHILARVVTALAARARFSIDRLSDAQLVTDAIVAHAPESLDGTHLALGIDTSDRRLDIRVGRLRIGQAQMLVRQSAVGGLGPLLEKLTDDVEVEYAQDGELLRLRLLDRR